MRNSDVGFVSWIGFQFRHAPWHGLTLWDLVEASFMFIVGVAIPFSTMKRLERGESWKKIFYHVLQRSALLFFIGIAYYWASAGRPVFRLWNVLTQLSFTYLVAFLLMRKPLKIQILAAFACLALTELLYRSWWVPGFDQPFVADQNFGSWFDLQIMGVLERDHWVAFNALPTAAFTIWGVVTGLILRSDRTDMQKFKILAVAGLIGILLGVGLDPITTIVKRVGSSSYVIVSAGICLVLLALSYWIVDMKKVAAIPKFFVIVGMNPLFIYVFDQFGGTSVLLKIAKPFAYGLLSWTGDVGVDFLKAILGWLMLWYICYWLYHHKILIKL